MKSAWCSRAAPTIRGAGNGRLTQIPKPAIDAVLALVIQRAKIAEPY
jgi:hypothetical protein